MLDLVYYWYVCMFPRNLEIKVINPPLVLYTLKTLESLIVHAQQLGLLKKIKMYKCLGSY